MGLFLRGLLLSIAIPMLQRSHLVIYIIDEMETESIKFNSQYQQTETETETENHNNNVKRRSRKISGIASDQVMIMCSKKKNRQYFGISDTSTAASRYYSIFFCQVCIKVMVALLYYIQTIVPFMLLLISTCSPRKLPNDSAETEDEQDFTPYFSVSLDPKDQFHFFWKVHYEFEKVEIEIRANMLEDQWLAVGFSDYGEVTNADACIYWTDQTGKTHFQDVYTDSDSFVATDEENNCILLNSRITKRHLGTKELHILYSRKFDTCDENDYIIEVKVPNQETTYWCSLHKLPPMDKKHHLIQFGPAVQAGNEPLVHHMELFHCEVDKDEDLPHWDGPCSSPNKPKILEACKRVIAAWATGAEALAYPEEAGEPIGGPDFNPYVMLEVHYNNPELKSDWIDSSGISFFYTQTLRKYDAGTMELGLEYTDKMAIPPGQNAFQLDSFCVAECTRIGLNEKGINIFASQLHTHLTGIQVYTKHIRGGKELPELNRDNHYSTHFQEIRRLKKVVEVQPVVYEAMSTDMVYMQCSFQVVVKVGKVPMTFKKGDALITTCKYRTQNRINVTLGGFSITDEMCVNYIHYYPKGNLEVCKSSIDTDSLMNYFKFMKSYEDQNTSLRKGINDNYHSIHWSQLNADLLRDFYKNSPLSMQCNQSTGERFPGLWNGISTTKINIPLTENIRKCSKESSKTLELVNLFFDKLSNYQFDTITHHQSELISPVNLWSLLVSPAMAQRSLFDLGFSKKRKPDEVSLEISVAQSVTKKSKLDATPGSSSKSRAFQDAWLKQFDWLEYYADTKRMFCKTCRAANISNSFTRDGAG
ncbi:Dopamine beta-hydroxylase [Nymphon striatum]|nr:Dopamine beta-hydroxylase [Nymphon striatum]